MVRYVRPLLLGAAGVLAAACTERLTANLNGDEALDAAFVSSPVGFENTTSSFSGGNVSNDGFTPGRSNGRGPEGRGPNGLTGGRDFMGGGLHIDFLGGPIGGKPFEHGRSPSSCTYAASTGVVTCAPETREGLTVTRTFIFKDATGKTQPNVDSTTNTVVAHVEVKGTRTRHDGAVTTAVSHVSDRTVSGLAKGSTTRSVDGTSSGTETTTGKDSVGSFTAVRTVKDVIAGVKVPVSSGRPSYPVAGSVSRSFSVTVSYTGKTPTSSTRSEVLTYDGSATAKLVITHNGTTKTCSVPLPHGRPICP